jgi:nitronate monooxygenase
MTLTELLGIELSIVQAPMAGVQDHELAVAVSNAGGLGSLPCAMMTPETLRNELAALEAKTSAPYLVNFFCHEPPSPNAEREARWRALLSPYYDEYGIDPATVAAGPGRAPFNSEFADALEDFKPPVVSFHFGLPSADLLKRVKSWGAKILSTATTVEEARWLEARGVDAIIAQGSEAGGHRGIFLSEDLTAQLGTIALVPQIASAVKIPVLAAGGIADANGVAAAMALGACGVQIGTAYMLCPEATTSAVHRAALKSEAAPHTALTNIFTGRAARGIKNRLMNELGAIRTDVPDFPLASAAIAPLRANAERRQLGDFTSLWCGQNATGCREIPAGTLTRELAAGLAHRR